MPDAATPMQVSRASQWVSSAKKRLWDQGHNPYHAMGDVRRVTNGRPLLLPTIAGWMLLAAIGGSLGVLGVFTIASRRSRWFPYTMVLRLRARTALHAFGLAWPWSIGFAALAGAAVWFVGFDRNGWSRSLIAGLAPTRGQTAAVVVLWGIATVLAMAFFLRTAAAAIVRGPVCLRCLYSLQGLSVAICPECGASVEILDDVPTTRKAHRDLLRCAIAGAVIGGCGVTIALATSPSARRWLSLRPQERTWMHVATLQSDTPPMTVTSKYGELQLQAQRVHPSNGNKHGSWKVHWQFLPTGVAKLSPAVGVVVVSGEPAGPGNDTSRVESLPPGEYIFYTAPLDPQMLVVGGPWLVHSN